MKFDLEDRVIKFGVAVLEFSEKMPESKAATHLSGQLIRSATAPALMYAEASGAESRSDFIHKMGIALKELHETRSCLQIIKLKKCYHDVNQMDHLIDESNQLVAIFGKSINTAKSKISKTG